MCAEQKVMKTVMVLRKTLLNEGVTSDDVESAKNDDDDHEAGDDRVGDERVGDDHDCHDMKMNAMTLSGTAHGNDHRCVDQSCDDHATMMSGEELKMTMLMLKLDEMFDHEMMADDKRKLMWDATKMGQTDDPKWEFWGSAD
jgi:hypothetical protein